MVKAVSTALSIKILKLVNIHKIFG